jgi:hypothetical protein
MKYSHKKMIGIILGIGIILSSYQAKADLAQIKIYKEAFSDSKPKCIECHVSEKPKKEDGAHELNEYGKAVKEVTGEEEIDAENYTKIGKIEDFKK